MLKPLVEKTTISYQVKECLAINPSIYRVFLIPAAAQHLDYQAGQYLRVEYPEHCSLAYSIANAPTANQQIELHIRWRAEQTQLEQLFNDMRSAQALLHVSGPYGHCIYSKISRPTLLLAGGIGFAPCKAIIEQQLKQGLQQPLYLYWGAQSQVDLYLHDLMQDWAKQHPNFYYIPVLSGAHIPGDWQGRSGWVHQAVLDDYLDLSNFQIYASGPLTMVAAAKTAFIQRGLHKDYFCSDLLVDD